MNLEDFDKLPEAGDLIITATLPKTQIIDRKSDSYLYLSDGDVRVFGDATERLLVHIPLEELIERLTELRDENAPDSQQVSLNIEEDWQGEWSWYISGTLIPPGKESRFPSTCLSPSYGREELRQLALTLIKGAA